MKRQLCMLLALLLQAAFAGAENFGDEVTRCLVGKGAKTNTVEFDAAISMCEQQVEAHRRLDNLRDSWHICLLGKIANFDDGISTASDIATGVQYTCKQEHAALINASFPTDAQMRYLVESNSARDTKELATSLVLIHRATKNKERALPKSPSSLP